MSLVRTKQFFPCHQPLPKPALLMCGLWGSTWQVKRLIRVLNKAGYDVTALDFPNKVISSGDASLLPKLTDEVVAYAESVAKQASQPVLLVGISLGALLALNVVRRSPLYESGVLITGGDIAKIAKKLYPRKWRQPYAELARAWQDVNMYTEPERLAGKRLLFVLHPNGWMIQPHDAYEEASKQNVAGNTILIVERPKHGHIGTVIEETILHPERVLTYIDQVKHEQSAIKHPQA